jgi:hypothetical protein
VIPLDEASSRLVLVVYIPGEQDTPFVTADGRIYVRVQDSSDPMPANNRYDLERIEARGRKSKDIFAKFCHDTRTFSKADEDLAWLHVFFMPYPSGLIERFELTTEDGLAQALELSKDLHEARIGDTVLFSANTPFTAAQLSTESVILRQVMQARAGRLSLTMELFQGGNAKVHIPLYQITNPIFRRATGSGHPDSLDALESSEVAAILRDLRTDASADEDQSLDLVKFFDLGQFWMTLINLLNFYEAWLGDDSQRVDLKVALTLEGVWRYCAFLDAAVWAKHVRKYGLPIMHTSTVHDPWLQGEAFLLQAGRARQLWLDFGPHVTRLVGRPPEDFAEGIAVTLEHAYRSANGR